VSENRQNAPRISDVEHLLWRCFGAAGNIAVLLFRSDFQMVSKVFQSRRDWNHVDDAFDVMARRDSTTRDGDDCTLGSSQPNWK
jgi:hypothetical protein